MAGLRRAAHRNCIDGGRVTITVAVVFVPTSVAGCPDEDGAFAPSASSDAVFEGPRREFAGSIDRFAVIIGAPRSGVNVDVVRIVT